MEASWGHQGEITANPVILLFWCEINSMPQKFTLEQGPRENLQGNQASGW
jgi:hypothetical protein